MYFLRRFMPNLVCCFGQHEVESSHPATLQSLPQRGSPASAALPSSSIPNISATKDDLRKIFASPSTPGGYNAARAAQSRRLLPQGSLDLNFQFGRLDAQHKKQGSLEQLSLHLREKLSATRPKASSARDKSSSGSRIPVGKPPLNEETQELAASQRSTGLTDLLTTRAADEGGYDSDAISIRTPMLRSNAGTFRASPTFAQMARKSIELQELHDSPGPPPSKDQKATKHTPHPVSVESGFLPLATQYRVSSATQTGADRPHTDPLPRPHMGPGGSMIKVRDRSELEVRRARNAIGNERGWRLSVSTPRRTSSLAKNRLSLQFGVDRLHDRSDHSRPDLTDVGTLNHSNSLFSDLGPGLIDYLERCATATEPDSGNLISSPVTAIRVDQHAAHSPLDHEMSPSRNFDEANDRNDIRTRVDSLEDGNSLHLYDMRISQRLAGSSANHISSASASRGSLSLSRASTGTGSGFYAHGLSNTRYASFIANEPNRRPSDPGTKKLFESAVDTARPQINGRHRAGNYEGQSSVPQRSRPSALVDDSSSVYSCGPGAFDGLSVPPLLPRTVSLRNQNSIAIGGRSASAAFPLRNLAERIPASSSATIGSTVTGQIFHEASSADGVADAAAKVFARRSISLPWQQRLSQSQETPTPKGRRCQHSTDDNERLSFEGFPSVVARRQPQSSELSTQAADERRDESFSEINYRHFWNGGKDRANNGNLDRQRFDNDTSTGSCSALLPDKPRKMDATLARVSLGGKYNQLDFPQSKQKRKTIPMPLPRTPDEADKVTVGFKENIRQVSPRNRDNSSGSDPCQQPLALHVRNRSHSTGDLGVTFRDIAEDLKQKHSMPLLSSKPAPLHSASNAHFRSSGLKKVSLQSLVRKLSMIRSLEIDPHADSSRLRKSFGLWSSFPVRGKSEKKGSAALEEDAQACECQDLPLAGICQRHKSTTGQIEASTPTRWLPNVPKLRLSRLKTQSTTFATPSIERSQPGRRRVARKLCGPNRVSSSEFQHQSAVQSCASATSPGAENPEVECFTDDGSFSDNHAEHHARSLDADGASDSNYETTSQRAIDGGVDHRSVRGGITTNWTDVYADCVGSMSALRSHTSAEQPDPRETRQLNSEAEMRESTLDFQAAMEREGQAAREKLLDRLRTDNLGRVEDEGGSEMASLTLSMPGSFD